MLDAGALAGGVLIDEDDGLAAGGGGFAAPTDGVFAAVDCVAGFFAILNNRKAGLVAPNRNEGH